MALPSLDPSWQGGQRVNPRVYVLEVRGRNRPDGTPVAWLMIEREEIFRHDERDGSIHEASIRLSYERIDPNNGYRVSGSGFFSGSYSRGFSGKPSASLTSGSIGKGAVFLDPHELRGHRVGTYLMNEIVTWVRQWPDATVRSVELLESDSYDENKARRNRFYEQFGLIFDYHDPEHRHGVSLPMHVSALTPVETWKANLRERDVREFIGHLLYDNDRMNLDLRQRESIVEYLRGEIRRAEANPVRWALWQLWQLWQRYAQTVVAGLVLGGLAVLAWSTYKV